MMDAESYKQLMDALAKVFESFGPGSKDSPVDPQAPSAPQQKEAPGTGSITIMAVGKAKDPKSDSIPKVDKKKAKGAKDMKGGK